jgi:hypothetical protein
LVDPSFDVIILLTRRIYNIGPESYLLPPAMKADALSHLGIDAWLEDPDGMRLPLGPAVIDLKGVRVSAKVQVENPKVRRRPEVKSGPKEQISATMCGGVRVIAHLL